MNSTNRRDIYIVQLKRLLSTSAAGVAGALVLFGIFHTLMQNVHAFTGGVWIVAALAGTTIAIYFDVQHQDQLDELYDQKEEHHDTEH